MAIEAVAEAGMGEILLRELVRAMLRDRCLPRETPVQLWGGDGNGWQCDVCGHPIAKGEAEYELLFARVADASLHLHRACYEMWEIERQAT